MIDLTIARPSPDPVDEPARDSSMRKSPLENLLVMLGRDRRPLVRHFDGAAAAIVQVGRDNDTRAPRGIAQRVRHEIAERTHEHRLVGPDLLPCGLRALHIDLELHTVLFGDHLEIAAAAFEHFLQIYPQAVRRGLRIVGACEEQHVLDEP